ncbi:hypothetical protein INP57_23350 [Saccharopolyspora sp. HNM0986]|nr:hypothetical protein [Saccharopolyspora sp. HNM0986]
MSIGTGAILGIVGLVLWRTTEGIETPVIGLSQLGLVLLVVGVIEIVVSGIALANPSTRYKKHDV